jgi:hypothetical protein
MVGVAVAVLVAVNVPTTPSPSPPPAAPVPSEDRDLALNAEHCLKGAETLEEMSLVISDAGGFHGDEVLSALDEAEQRMARRIDTPSERLTGVFEDLEAGLGTLRQAVTADEGVNAALDDVIDLTYDLDSRCHDVLTSRPAG